MNSNKSRDLNLKISRKYFATFAFIISLGIIGQILQQYHLSYQESHSKIINESGRQRMLSQRLIKLILLNENSSKINDSLNKLLSSHMELTQNSLGLSGIIGKEVYKKLKTLSKKLKQIETNVECFSKECKTLSTLKNELNKQADAYLFEMDRIVTLHVQYANQEFKKFKVAIFLNFILILLTFLLILYFIVYPTKSDFIEKIDQYEKERNRNEVIEAVSSTGTWELDIASGSTLWSNEVYKIHSLSTGININKIEAIEFYHEKDQPKLLNYIDRCIKFKETYDAQLRFTDSKGIFKWVRVIGQPIEDSNGEVKKLVGIIQDITHLKEKEEEAKSSSELFKVAVQGAKLGIWKWDIANDTVDFDSEFLKMIGLNEKIESNIEVWRSRVHKQDIAQCYIDIKNYMKDQSKGFENIHRLKHTDGRWIYILSRGKFTSFDENNRATRFIGTCQDITKTIKSQNEQKLILQSLQLGIWKWDITNNNLEWDESLYDLYGYKKDDFSSSYEAWESTIDSSNKEEATKALQDALAGEKDFDTTFKIKTKNGQNKYIGGKGIVERNIDNDPVYMYGINWDKTKEVVANIKFEEQRKIAEQNAKLANVGEMAAGVGHEINNPLSIIKGYLSIMLKTATENTDKLVKISQAADRIEHIVAGLRQFVRSTDNDEEIISVTGLLKTTVNMMSELYLKEGIELSYKNANNHHNYSSIGNLGKIQQIVVNLITNAKDAVKDVESPQIKISSNASVDQVFIYVQDNGKGIPKEIQERIFDPFFTTKDVNKGTGIGLSLAYSIVKDHGGDISFTTKKNEGSIFKITLPRTSQVVQNSSETFDFKLRSKYLGKHVLLVDDEKDLIEIVADMLEDLGAEVYKASNGEEAYDFFKNNSNSVDLVITDMQMPIMNGTELVKKIRSSKELAQPKIIIATGGVNIDIEDNNNELNSLVDQYIFKPFSIENLVSTISKLDN